jgi:S1-C subfamily serine protease
VALEVEQDSAAWRAGLRPRTLIKQVDGKRVASPDEFFAAVAAKSGNVRLRLITAMGESDVVVGP